MTVLVWILLLGGALLAGAAFVGVLVVSRSAEAPTALLGIIGLGMTAWAFAHVNDVYPRPDALLYAFVLALAALAGGYALASVLLDQLAGEPRQVKLRSNRVHPVSSKVAVVLFSCTEPELYSARVTARELADLASGGLLDAGITVTPFLFTAEKARYRAAGGRSPAFRQLRQVADSVESTLADAGYRVRADAASCDGASSLVRQVASLAERGFGTIVVAPYAVSDSLSMDAAMRTVDALRLQDEGVQVAVAEPLWGSDAVVGMMTERVLAAVGEPGLTGVVLIAHGQPDARVLTSQAFDEQETVFLNRVRAELLERGLPPEHVRIGWSEWRDPDVSSSVRHLAALGCTRILVAPAVYPVESIGTMLDLPMSVRQARVDEWVSVVILPAWRDDPAAIKALSSTIERALKNVRIEEAPSAEPSTQP